MRGKGILKLVLLAAAVALSLTLMAAGSMDAVGVDAAGAPAFAEQVLGSTVQIEMVGQAWQEDGLQQRLAAQGLGTLVQAGERRFILTHDHWSLANDAFSHVAVRNAHGAQLLVLDGATFLSLVRYRDGGAMLLEAPQELSGVTPARLHDGSQPAAGDTVWLPARAGVGNGLRLSEARVELVRTEKVPGTLQLRGAPDAVAAGDSGGGVWFDGRLVANLWAATEVRAVAEDSPWPWSQWFGIGNDWQRTGDMLAGLQPLQGATGLSPEDLAPATTAEPGYERGPQK